MYLGIIDTVILGAKNEVNISSFSIFNITNQLCKFERGHLCKN